ncbi:MAG: hypothetical protein JRM74_01560 [Nitrososphaerota archaeon]|nr:hypothetical protein [Nitrososphaerota archaeon]
MNLTPARKRLTIPVLCLLVAGLLAPIPIAGMPRASAQSASQLSTLIAATEGSGAYARSVVGYASSQGLSVSSSQALLSQGDGLLAAAQQDAVSGNLAAGIGLAQAAMKDYASAAAAASLAISSAGLSATVEYTVVEQAIVEVNATVNAAASVASAACAGAGISSPGGEAFVQACTRLDARIDGAAANLTQAAALAAQADGQASATASFSQAMGLVEAARAGMNSTQSEFMAVASYGYAQRADAYVSAVVDPQYAQANATIGSEQSAVTGLSGYQTSWNAYSQSQASATASIISSASALDGAISQVNTGAVSTSVSAASTTAGKVNSDMSILLNLAGIMAFTNLVQAIQACETATTSYSNTLASAGAWSEAYSGTPLASFSSYLGTGTSDVVAVQSAGSAYVSDYQTVVADLTPILSALPAAQTVYGNLTSLQVSGTVDGANTAFGHETAAMGTVQADASSLNTSVSTSETAILVSGDLLAAASGASASGGAYLNATVRYSLGQVSTYASATAQAAQAFVASAQACLRASIGTYLSADTSLSASGASLGTQTKGSVSATTAAATYLEGDSRVRIAAVAAGRADLTQALQFFSSQNISAGAAAVAQANLEFQAASGASA